MDVAVLRDDRIWPQRAAHALVALLLLLATAAIVGRLVDVPQWASFGVGNIPMAPITSACFVVQGVSLLLAMRSARPAVHYLGALGAILSALCGFLVLRSGFATGTYVPATFQAAGIDDFYANPLSLMSPAAGALFMLAGAALAWVLVARARAANPAFWVLPAATAGVLVATAAVFIVVSYAVAAPLFYAGTMLPMALPTAISFALLGGGLLAMAAHGARWPIFLPGRLADVSIAMQLRAGLGAIVFAVVGLAYVVHLQSNVMWAQTRELHEHPLVVIRTTAELKVYTLRMHGILDELARAPADRDLIRLARTMVEAYLPVGEATRILGGAYRGPPEDITALNQKLTEWQAIYAPLLGAQSSQTNEDVSRLAAQGAAAALPVLDHLRVIGAVARGAADQLVAESERRNRALELAVLAMFAVVMLGALWIGGVLNRQISGRVRELTSVAAQFAQGNLAVRSASTSANELGVLATTFNAMADTIQANLESNAQLAAQLRRSEASLSAQNKELEAFSYSVSHDLRTPLRSVDGFSRILLEDHDASLDAEGRDCLKRIRAAAEHMAHLIDDLLRLSRLSRAELCREPIDLSAMAQEIAAQCTRQDPSRQVDFVVAGGVVAHGDRRLLRVALTNLLDNAFKFTRTRTDARIEFGTCVRDGRPCYFVRDNGVGFDPKYADKLFGAFQRLHGKDEFPGTGIGLATVQRVIHRHGGKVWAEGAVDQGATFSFDLGT